MNKRMVITFGWENEQRSVCMLYTEYVTSIHSKCSELKRSLSPEGHYQGAFKRGVWFYMRIEGFMKSTTTTSEEPSFMTFNCAGCMWKKYILQNPIAPEPLLEKECDMCSWRTNPSNPST